MTLADFWASIWPWIVSGAGGFIGAALLLPTKLGEAVFKFRLDKEIEGFKSEQAHKLEAFKSERVQELETFKASQTQTVEILKEQLNHLGDRGKRSNEMEYAAIQKVWEQFVEAYLATNTCIVNFTQIPDFARMTDEEFDSFLTTVDFSEQQKHQLRKSSDRIKTYSDICSWKLIVRAQHANFDARTLLRKQGIFMPTSLSEAFRSAIEVLVSAQVEQQMDHQHKRSGIGYEKRSALLSIGEALFKETSALANKRLFREERDVKSRGPS